jgi:nitrite reductase/ring-hydroxylating ferredoxin subunit
MDVYVAAKFPQATLSGIWTNQEAVTVDSLPLIGKYSQHATTQFLATGFGKWGMTQGTLAGLILCDMVLDRDNPYTELYSPQRKAISADLGRVLFHGASDAFRRAAGMLHAGSPVCSYCKCRLVYNEQENTWDCPCHGCRFDGRGSVLEGPAVRGIAQEACDSRPDPSQ